MLMVEVVGRLVEGHVGHVVQFVLQYCGLVLGHTLRPHIPSLRKEGAGPKQPQLM